jgi:hypothetical protein
MHQDGLGSRLRTTSLKSSAMAKMIRSFGEWLALAGLILLGGYNLYLYVESPPECHEIAIAHSFKISGC